MSEVNSGMVLKHSVARKKLHHRQISCEGFIRDDGLWDIEANLLDSRTYDCSYDETHRGGLIRAGEPVHDMWLCLTIDLDFVIHEVAASSDKTPFGACTQATAAMQGLVGIKMGSGWMRLVRQKIGSRQGCTHLIDLLGPISATAYQTLHAELEKQAASLPVQQKPTILDTCFALSSDGDVVKKRWPDFYTGVDKPQSKE
jgi:hypothetical protein